MAKKKTFEISNSLAQALGETISAAKDYSGALNIDVVPIKKIELDQDNPRDMALTFADVYHGLSRDDKQYERKSREKDSLKTMAKSIQEQGVLNPIIVYKSSDKYRLVAGERRTLASILCDKESIQARVLEGKPTQLTLGLLQWIENIEREDLTLWERLRNLEKIITAFAEENKRSKDGVSVTDISQLLGCSVQLAANYRSVLAAPSKLNILIKNNQIKNLEKAALVSRSPLEKQDELMDACLNGATLKSLKTLLEAQVPTTQTKKKESRGRSWSQVNFGTTKDIRAAKIIISTLFEHERFSNLRSRVYNAELEDFSSLTKVFRLLVQEIEKMERK